MPFPLVALVPPRKTAPLTEMKGHEDGRLAFLRGPRSLAPSVMARPAGFAKRS